MRHGRSPKNTNVEPTEHQPRKIQSSQKPGLPRQYLVIILVAFGISLLLSPPTFRTESATGAVAGETLPKVPNQNRLTVRLAQTLGEGEFTIAARDVQTGETYEFGADKQYDAASTTKLLFAAYLYHQASEGQLDLDQIVSIPDGEVQRYGTGTIQNSPGPHRYTYRELARLMMEQSDNTAAYVLSNRLGLGELQTFGESLGMTKTDVTANTTTATDMRTLAEAVQKGTFANPELTAELQSILDDSAFEDRLPAELPEGASVYHKTGDAFGGGLHDVGFIEYQGRTYVVAMMTDHQGNAEKAKLRMAEASLYLFAYFNRAQ